MTTKEAHEPASYPRRILLALSGLSPQVLTETVYGLSRQDPPFHPTEIHLFTTREGVHRARLLLLSEDPGWFHRLRADYGLPEMSFGTNRIHSPLDEDGEPLEDLRTPEENRITADTLTELVRSFTMDDEVALHVSMAGGRRTMGFFAGYALSLYGREQDRLSHVLVDKAFESDPQFFYPSPDSRVIFSHRRNEPLDCRDAKVILADIPFVRLRQGLPRRLLEGQTTFSATVAAAQKASEPPHLELRPDRMEIEAGGTAFSVSPTEFAFYYWFAQRQRDELDPVRWTDEGLAELFLGVFRTLVPEMDASLERAESALAAGMDKNYFDQRKSRANQLLRQHLGRTLARRYEITGRGRRPNTRFGLLGLDAKQISICQGGLSNG